MQSALNHVKREGDLLGDNVEVQVAQPASPDLNDINDTKHEIIIDVETQVERFIRYHLEEDHRPSGGLVAMQQIALVISGLGGLNYTPVAYANGSTVSIAILNAVSTSIIGCIVLCNASIDYYRRRIEPQYIPDQLIGIVEAPLTSEEYRVGNRMIGLCALFSAVPLATTLFAAKLPVDSPVAFWLWFGFVLVVNTVMHFLPIELTLRHEVYGILSRIPSQLIRLLVASQPSQSEIDRLEKQKNRGAALANIMPVLENAKTHFFNQLTRASGHDLGRLAEYSRSSDQLLRDMLTSYTVAPKFKPEIVVAARVAGAAIVAIACLGYAANPFLVFQHNDYYSFPVWAAAMITALPIYFFMVLMTYFGDYMGQRVLQDTMMQGDSVIKFPAMSNLYPKTFAGFVLLNLFFVAFAGAPAREMMKLAFENVLPDALMIVLYGCADIGIGMLAWYTPLDYEKMQLNHYAQYRDTGAAQTIAILKAKVEAMFRDLNRLEPKVAEAFAHKIEKVIGGIKSTKNNNSDQSGLIRNSWFSCLYENVRPEQRPLLSYGVEP